MYATNSMRTPREVLRFHNVTYQHGNLCVDLFGQGSSNFWPVFSLNNLSLTTPATFNMLNTEVQERIFGQAKQITKACLQPNHVITNILTRVHAESTSYSNTLQIQEGEIHKLAQVLGKASNTIIPKEWIHSNHTLHQAHLERISDFVLCGPGVWWQDTPAGIEFFDGDAGPSSHSEGLILHHFRSASLADIDIYLHKNGKNVAVEIFNFQLNTYDSISQMAL